MRIKAFYRWFRSWSKLKKVSCMFFILYTLYQLKTYTVKLLTCRNHHGQPEPFINGSFKKVLYEPKNTQKNLTLVVFIVTTPNNRKQRDAIRSTWANCENLQTLTFAPRHLPKQIRCQRIFVIGKPVCCLNTLSEAKELQDMLILDYEETYRTIYFKVMSMFNWVIKYSPRWVLKADDDVYVHLPRLIMKIFTLNHVRFYGGRVVKNVRVKRRPAGRTFVNSSNYKPYRYPPFCSGASYLITTDLLADFFKASKSFPMPFVDDAYIGVLMNHIGVVPYHFDDFWIGYNGKAYIDNETLKTNLVIGHRFDHYQLEQLHARIKELDEVIAQ